MESSKEISNHKRSQGSHSGENQDLKKERRSLLKRLVEVARNGRRNPRNNQEIKERKFQETGGCP